MGDNKRKKRDSIENDADLGAAATGMGGGATAGRAAGNLGGMGASAGYDTQGELGSIEAGANHPATDSHETTSAGRGGRGRGSGEGGAAGDSSAGGGTGGMTGVDGAGSRQGMGDSDKGVDRGNDIAPLAGGVAVSGGRGSDLGDADHGMTRERGGLSGGSFGGSGEQETGGGLSGSMREGAGSDASGGVGGSRSNNKRDPAEGSNDVATDSKPGGVNERS